jgi:F-type H+-transporting ATPase subunit epsilon
MLPEAIQLDIVIPERRLISEVVDEVVLPGVLGSLGVLPGHAPLLTTLGIGEVVFRRGSVRHYLSVAWGFAEVLPDRVSILAEVAERAEEIDRARAEQARDRAVDRLKGRDPDTDFNRAQVALQKALVRLQVSARAGAERSV